MKLEEGIKLQGSPAIIPDCSRDDLPQFFKDRGYTTGVEVGVLRGEFTEKLCQAGLKVFGIDPWKFYGNYKRHPREQSGDDIYQTAQDKLSKYPNCTLLRKMSMEALADFPDESLDFVYIDANHTLPYVVQDIWEWNKKVKSGGVISGHDYLVLMMRPYSWQACQVEHGVDICAKALYIKNYFVLGDYRPNKGEKRDKHRSWMWIKP
jgi:hypothetical protein